MRLTFFLLIISALFGAGIITYCLMNNIIIIRNLNTPHIEYRVTQSFREQKKQIVLFFFKHGSFKKEIEYSVLTESNHENTMILINRWLTVLADEAITPSRISLQSASYDISGKKLIISFEQSFLNAPDPIFKKLMCIESLLKTIRENIKEVQEIYLLVQHQPLQDYHIDTTHAWPINGFTEAC
jgi:hypothetical protein